MSDAFQGKHDQIGDISQQIEGNDYDRAQNHCTSYIAFRVPYFTGREGGVALRVCGEKRAGLAQANRNEQAECGGGAEPWRKRPRIADGPEVMEIFTQRAGVAAQ